MGQAHRRRAGGDRPQEDLPLAHAGEVDAGESASEPGRPTPLTWALLAAGDHWTLRIVAALATAPLRLSDLRVHLPGISTGVLDRHLQQMVVLHLIVRVRHRELPPRVEYRLDVAGEELVPVAAELALWGGRHM